VSAETGDVTLFLNIKQDVHFDADNRFCRIFFFFVSGAVATVLVAGADAMNPLRARNWDAHFCLRQTHVTSLVDLAGFTPIFG